MYIGYELYNQLGINIKRWKSRNIGSIYDQEKYRQNMKKDCYPS